MSALSVASVIEKNRLDSGTPFLVCLDIQVISPSTGNLVETLYVVRNSEPITWQGNLYAALNFDVDIKAEAGEQSDISLKMVDYTRAVQARMQQYGGGVGFGVTVSVVNAGNLEQPPEIQEFFEVVGAKAADYNVTFTLGSENALAMRFPRRIQMRDRCAWRYKSEECGYTGQMTSCDLTLRGNNGCAMHNNTLNFGGYPGINASGYRGV